MGKTWKNDQQIKNKTMEGLDSLLSTVQMPPGVPVAVVGINSAKNAGILAVEILATSDKNLEKKIIGYKSKLEKENKIKGERDPKKEILKIRQKYKTLKSDDSRGVVWLPVRKL